MDSEPMNKDTHDAKFLNRKSKRIVLIATMSLVVLGVLIFLTMHFTSQPNFCASCHEIRPSVITWNVGPHKSMTCLDCHANPGKVGYVMRKFQGLGEVYLHVVKKSQHPVANFNIQTCIVCHTGNNKDYPDAKNIKLAPGELLAPKLSHNQILQDNISCLVCHRYVGHGEPQQPTQ